MLSVLPPTNQTRIAANHVVAGCVKLLQKVGSGSSFCTNICICYAFFSLQQLTSLSPIE